MQYNERRLLIGFSILTTAIALVIYMIIFKIEDGLELAKKYGYDYHPNIAAERREAVWLLLPYAIMALDLLWQYEIIKTKRIKSINISSIMIASSVGILMHYMNNYQNSDPFANALGNVVNPILILVIYGIARLCQRNIELKRTDR